MSKTADEIFRERQAEEGRKGGLLTLQKHGTSHFSRAAKKRWAKRKKHAKKK